MHPRNLIREYLRLLLTEAYGEKTVAQLKEKFKKENPELTDAVMDAYINKFFDNQNSRIVKSQPKGSDIARYTWHGLEEVTEMLNCEGSQVKSLPRSLKRCHFMRLPEGVRVPPGIDAQYVMVGDRMVVHHGKRVTGEAADTLHDYVSLLARAGTKKK